jgi:hypothetical protein
MDEKSNSKLNLLLAIFVGLLIGMNLLGGKITTLFGVSVSVGIFMVPLTFLITDIVEEVHGKKVAKQFLISGVVTLVITFVYIAFFVALPANERYVHNEAYKTIFGSSMRIIIASIVAFILSQFHDVWAFNFWKQKTKGKFLWLRNNASTIISQGIDTFVFMMIAFYQIAPKFDFAFIIKLSIPYYLFKIAFALIDTPFVYLGVKWLRGKREE